MSSDSLITPEQAARTNAEATGNWPEGWGPFHRHFASDTIHRDGGPECNQSGTPRRVYVFDEDYLSAHEAFITARVRVEERQRVAVQIGDMCTYRDRAGHQLPNPHPSDHLGPCPYGQAVERILADETTVGE